MTDFDTWLGQAWDRHAEAPDGAALVAAQLDEGLALAASPAQLVQLSHLAQHLHGEHLGQWAQGRQWQQALAAHPHFGPEVAAAVRWRSAALALAEGDAAAADALTEPGEAIRARALAGSAIAATDPARAGALLQSALAAAEAIATAGGDTAPFARSLAVTANNLAAALEDKTLPSRDERALMLLAAQAGRRWWGVAGTWLETERAEYRLSKSHLKAGDAAQARRHAQLCLEIVQAHAAPPLEHFFGWEALALAEKALLDVDGHAKALAQARQAYEALDDGDKGWCRASLEAIDFGRR
jgi:hypothetical protein